jgi:transcriptional regulator GlxA family with amidase domain
MTERSRFLQKGAASFPIRYDGPIREFYFALLPKLTMLALSSAIEPLRIANQIAQQELYRWHTMSADGKPVTCSNNLTVVPDGKLAPVARTATVFACSGVEPLETLDPAVTGWVRHQRKLGSRIGGLCTGAFTLAKAGLLGKARFTLHWENQTAFIESFVDLLPSMNLYELEDGIITAAGGSAATDLMLKLIEADHGPKFALVVADMCLHGRSNAANAAQRSSASVTLGSRNQHLIAAVQLMQENLEDPLGMSEIAAYVGLSRRQLERNFATHLGTSPRKYYVDLRIARAYALLSETNLSVQAIAAATGFETGSNLARLFRAKYGQSPSGFSKSWNNHAPHPPEKRS